MRENLKLVRPKAGRTSYYHMRGSYLGVATDCSTRSRDKATAREILAARKADIEAVVRAARTGRQEPTFAEAVTRYLSDRGDERFLPPLINAIGMVSLGDITQEVIEATAFTLYPKASPATRNRQVFTPILAVLHHSGVALVAKRPKGANGTARRDWLTKEDAGRLLRAAWALHPRFAALLTFLLYTGCRLSEALRLEVAAVHVDDAYAHLGKTKTGKPRGAYLPPAVLRAIALALAEPANATYARPKVPRARGSLFCLTKSGALYALLDEVETYALWCAKLERGGGEAGVDEFRRRRNDGCLGKLGDPIIPPGVSFHIFRHTYGAWCRRYGKLDRAGMVGTGAWASDQGAASYDHIEISAAARAVDLFPGAMAGGPPLHSVAGGAD